MTIFDLVVSREIVAYWELLMQDREPYLGEELFPNDKQLGLSLSWLKGANGTPVVLKASAFDVAAIPRPRIGVQKLSAEMPFFKESKYVDEELRQQLNTFIAANNQASIDLIIERIFKDEVDLLEGAAARREQMRMMLISTGSISIESNGQLYEYDYHVPSGHIQNATVSWDNPDADIVGDIKKGLDTVEEDTGVRPSRVITSTKVLGYMRKNTTIRDTINDVTNPNKYISDAKLKQFLADEFELTVEIYNKKYAEEDGTKTRFVPEDLFIMLPDGNLGNTMFGTTPEESDLLTSNIANVTITDTGVAVTTTKETDPVQVDTKVTMICLPTFPTADQIYILDTLLG